MNLGKPVLNDHKLFYGSKRDDVNKQMSNNIYHQVRDETYWEILLFLDFQFGAPVKAQMFKVQYNL